MKILAIIFAVLGTFILCNIFSYKRYVKKMEARKAKIIKAIRDNEKAKEAIRRMAGLEEQPTKCFNCGKEFSEQVLCSPEDPTGSQCCSCYEADLIDHNVSPRAEC